MQVFPSSPFPRSPHHQHTYTMAAPPNPPRRSRTASFTQSILDANPHYGFCAATGDALSSAPSLKDLRRNSLSSLNSGSRPRGAPHRRSSAATTPATEHPPIHEEPAPPTHTTDADPDAQPHWWAVTKSGLHAFWTWFITPIVRTSRPSPHAHPH